MTAPSSAPSIGLLTEMKLLDESIAVKILRRVLLKSAIRTSPGMWNEHIVAA
jgi:hypothetical protein